LDNERASLEKKIADLGASGTDKAAEIAKLKEKIVEVDESEDELRRALTSLGDSLKSVGGSTSPSSEMMMIEMMKLMGKEKALRAPPADSKQTSPSEGQSRK
jgi:chromosome segregation ATPase